MSIQKIYAREILDSRGNPTVEVDLHTTKGCFRAAVPSGASTGIYEALELRDGDKSRYLGKGLSRGVFSSLALELLKSAIEKAGYPDKVVIGMDVAASEFFRSGKYDLDFKSPDDPARYISGEKLGELYQSFIKNYPVVSIEDPFDQDDWETWQKFLTQVPIQIVGDDLTVTNPKRIQKAVELKACNCLLLKVNQIGSVTESIQA
ncbi:beta-enolase-like [Chelonoidis abingdonii]|uniref:beta-enolase-like n=1 Tax=Chelonoidis abingdonii TaxID=106734 RepID=UPI003F49591F